MTTDENNMNIMNTYQSERSLTKEEVSSSLKVVCKSMNQIIEITKINP